MVAPLRRGWVISGWSHTRKIAKIVNEVSLIGVAVLCRNHAPVNLSGKG